MVRGKPGFIQKAEHAKMSLSVLWSSCKGQRNTAGGTAARSNPVLLWYHFQSENHNMRLCSAAWGGRHLGEPFVRGLVKKKSAHLWFLRRTWRMNILVFCDVQLIHVFYKCSAVTRTRYTFAQSLWPCLFRVCVAGRPVCVGVCVFRDVCVCVCVWPSPLRDRFFRRHVDTRVLAVTTAGRGEKSCARHMSCYHHCIHVKTHTPPQALPSAHTHIFPWFSLYPAATGERCRFNGG